MLIDWFTVIAQLINFLILVYLLNRFLYKPITKIMAERQQRIEQRWWEAEQQQEEAQRAADLYRQKQQELVDQRERRMVEARESAEQERKHLIHQARQEVEQMQAGWRESVQREQAMFLQTVQQQVMQQTCAIARLVLDDLADATLEQQIVATFLARLRELNASDRQALAKSVQQSDREILIRSSFEISQETQAQIAHALRENQIAHDHGLQFDTAAELICGIELQLPDRELTWNVRHYLRSLEEHLSTVLSKTGEMANERGFTPASRS